MTTINELLNTFNTDIDEYYIRRINEILSYDEDDNLVPLEEDDILDFINETFNADLHTWRSIFTPADITDVIILLMKYKICKYHKENFDIEFDIGYNDADEDFVITTYINVYLHQTHKLHPTDMISI